jgi:hypothetical protein
MNSTSRLIEKNVKVSISLLNQDVLKLSSAFMELAGRPRWNRDIIIARSNPSNNRNSGVFRLKPEDSCEISSMLMKKTRAYTIVDPMIIWLNKVKAINAPSLFMLYLLHV